MKYKKPSILTLGDDLALVEKLMEELQSLPPLDPEFERKLRDKYRLEWSYHSNHIEGNTLTYGETQLLIFKGIAAGDHEKQHYDEMHAHDVAIELILDWSRDNDRDITEADLRELNRIILVRPFWKEAITVDGLETRKKIVPGSYKTTPNSVNLKNGQIHQYASVEENPALMNELMNWYKNSGSIHPIMRGAVVHHELTRIHPFDDGNGRVSRLWLNFILIKAGYPPLIIRTENKEKYLTALAKADAGDFDPFVAFLCQELQWSIGLSIRAGRGEPLDEPGDLDKKIALLDQKITSLDNDETKVPKGKSAIERVVIQSFYPLLESIDDKLAKVAEWFNESQVSVYIDRSGLSKKSLSEFELVDQIVSWEDQLAGISDMAVTFSFLGFKKAGTKSFNTELTITIIFEKWRYTLKLDRNIDLMEKLYDQNLGPKESDEIVESFISKLIDDIEFKIENINRK